MNASLPTPDQHQKIVESLRAGGYEHVSAEAWGVSFEQFQDWLQRGRRRGAPPALRAFADEVRGAIAQARLRAEAEIFKDNPKMWLQNGPGRDRRGRPGWASATAARDGDEAENLLARPEIQALFVTLYRALEAYPEARVALADALTSLDPTTFEEFAHDASEPTDT